MRYAYLAIAAYLAVHLVWYIVRERRFWKQAGAALVLILFALRLLMIQ